MLIEEAEKKPQSANTVALRDVSGFIERVKARIPLCDAQRMGEELYGAPRLSIFELLSPNELTLTRVIADLFDPGGTHGQGPLFLNELLRELGFSELDWREAVRLDREVVMPSRRRIDLVIEGQNFVIGIENKPWAAQQDNQLGEYYEYIKSCAGRRKVAFVFISDQEEQSAQGKVERFPYFAPRDQRSLFRIISDTYLNCKSERSRRYLSDFLEWIQKTFGDQSMSDTFEKPYKEMIKTLYHSGSEERKAIATILLTAPELHEHIVNGLGMSIAADLKGKLVDIEIVGDKKLFECIDAKWSPWLIRRSSWPKNCYLALESDQWNCDKILFGVRALDPLSKEGKQNPELSCRARKKLDVIANSMQGGGRTSWWPWRRYLANGNWGLSYVGRLLVESDGNPNKHPHVQDLSARLLALVESVDAVLKNT